ncbi:MAG: diguanylate cyclase, partial [Chloroflexota bacterium]
LYYSSTRTALEWGGPLIISRGPMYWVALVQTYSLNLIAMGILIWRFVQSRHMYRKRLLYLVGAVLFPFVVNIVYQLVPDFIPFFSVPIDLTPLSFTITAILLAESIFGLRLFDLVPIARDTVMEYIPEMVFVTDSFDRIIDANATAQKWLGKPLDEFAGQDAIEVFKEWPQLLNRFFLTEHSREEIEISTQSPRTLELVITPIYDRFGALEGRVILAHDVTERKLLENKLMEANELLKLQLADIDALTTKLHEQAIRDPLTGAFNRRFFAESLDRETARAIRENVPMSVIIMDVDHFKQFNDTYGHKCGDIVLQALAKFLNDNTRRGDIVCRYGGEEFVILMPDASIESAYLRAEFLRSTFEQSGVEYDGQKMSCTLSMGVASYPIHATSSDALLIVADHALYRSKSEGRNRVTIYEA